MGKFGPKSQNCQFKLKFGTQSNSNDKNSMVMLTFFCFRPEIPFLDEFGLKNQNCQFKLKFGTYSTLNMQTSMMVLTFSVFKRKYPEQIRSKKSKLSVYAEIWCLIYFEYAEYNGGVHFFCY